MPDIRETLKGLSKEDAKLYSQTRTDMRRCYMAAHAQTLDVSRWTHEDDMVLDLIDIQIAMLFDRSGRFNAYEEGAKEPDKDRAIAITEVLHAKADNQSQRMLKNLASGIGNNTNGTAASNWAKQAK